ARIAAWDIKFANAEGAALKAVADKNGVRIAASAADAVREADIVIAAVTAASSVEAARSVAPHLAGVPYYLDINSVSPGRMQESARTLRELGVEPLMTDAMVVRHRKMGVVGKDARVRAAIDQGGRDPLLKAVSDAKGKS